ncbi:uncharacterized protein [Argopecten irradians]|uniref:uncharacterized protein n=1 Tax=Argopecten irradians TaxID=31199 RepID=UPI003713E5AA
MLPDIQAIVNNEIVPLRAEINVLKSENDDLKHKIDDLEQYSRKECVFSGFEETNGVENTTEMILEKVSKLPGTILRPEDIVRSHRVGLRNNNKPRQIIARLASREAKRNLMVARKQFKDIPDCKNIMVNEDLTKMRNSICFHARNLVKSKKILQTWTIDGKIFIKNLSGEKVSIRRESDLVPYGHVLTTVHNGVSLASE